MALTGVSSSLISLGTVFKKGLLSRPSKLIKSPYVADVIDNGFEQNPFSVIDRDEELKKTHKKKKFDELGEKLRNESHPTLAHAPSLDCAGMVVHGTNCFVTENVGTTTKTAYTIQLAQEEREEGMVLVGYHPNLAEKAAKAMLSQNLFQEQFGNYDEQNIESQKIFGNSRVDFVLHGTGEQNNILTLVEVKNVVGAEYLDGTVPVDRSPVGVYTISQEDQLGDGKRHAMFPHGSTKPNIGVVSDRAIKHVVELGDLQGTLHAESGRTIQTAVLFIVNRSDCSAFRPAHEACMMFSRCLMRSQKQGTIVLAQELVWELGEVQPNGGQTADANAGELLPVLFHKSVKAEEVDEDLLRRVLQYNADVPKTRSPPPKSRRVNKDEDAGTIGSSKKKRTRKEKDINE